jgi:hypothetical protein
LHREEFDMDENAMVLGAGLMAAGALSELR